MFIRNKAIYLLLVLVSVLAFCSESFAVPASPILHTLSQPDGTTFQARQWGDENRHGWQTEDGYTIVFETGINSWTYAIQAKDGSLVSSGYVVGKDSQPDVSKGIRPTGQIILMKQLTREKYPRQGLQAINSRTSAAPGDVGILTVPHMNATGNIPVILINFNDRATTYGPIDFETLLFGTGNYSMREYYEEVSYGRFTISSGPEGVRGWYTAHYDHNYYGQNVPCASDPRNGCDTNLRPAELVVEAVVAADNAGFNFAPYDQDGDCYVDVVNIIHQGTGEESSPSTSDIWSHRFNLTAAGIGEYTTDDPCPSGGFIKVKDYVIEPEIYADDNQIMTVGVFAHEYGHALGLPDLYDTDNSSQGIGDWSLMASGSWTGVARGVRSGDRPAHLDAWSKYFLDWVTPTQVTGTLTSESIQQAAYNEDVYQFRTGTSLSGEYFLVENRQKVGFDEGLPASGLLVWHIDANLIARKYTKIINGVPTLTDNIVDNTVNDDECIRTTDIRCAVTHYGVSLVQADDISNLEANDNNGDDSDPYPGTLSNTSFTSSSLPNSKLFNGSSCGPDITNISAPGATMTADLSPSGAACTVVSAGEGHTTAIDDGGLWVWGWNWYGQLGIGYDTNVPFPLMNGATWISVSAGGYFTTAVRSDGTLWAWGLNSAGQLGDGTTLSSSFPVMIGRDHNWASVAAGHAHTIAIKSDGTLWAWGLNSFGQLGIGSSTGPDTCLGSEPCSKIPVQIGSDNNWVSVSGGGAHSVAIKADGTLWAWGGNDEGELGIGSSSGPDTCNPPHVSGSWACSKTPVQVLGNNWVSVDAADSHSVALKSDGTLWTWGWNLYGQLGTGGNTGPGTCGQSNSKPCSASPVQIGGNWVSASAAGVHSIAVKSDGTLWAWGSNNNSALGLGSATGPETCNTLPCSTIPRQAGTDNNWLSVFAGDEHNIAQKSDGSLWGWGRNMEGQIGDGTILQRYSPIQIAKYWSLLVFRNGSGIVTSSPAGIGCGADCEETYDKSATTSVTLTPSTPAGSTFTGWSGECSGTGSCTIKPRKLDTLKSVHATFVINTYTLSVSKTGNGSGTVTSYPSGINCGAGCSEIYEYNTTVTLTASAPAGNTFIGWSGDCSGTGSCTVTMDADKSVEAVFACGAGTPSPEVCDGIDNDCNGQVDEGLSNPVTCGVGACAGNTGVETCTAGVWGNSTCNPFSGAITEICDGIDNDCDGMIDEITPVTCGYGVCASTGSLICQNGAMINTCPVITPTENPETSCNDGLDNDCDGAIDTADPNCGNTVGTTFEFQGYSGPLGQDYYDSFFKLGASILDETFITTIIPSSVSIQYGYGTGSGIFSPNAIAYPGLQSNGNPKRASVEFWNRYNSISGSNGAEDEHNVLAATTVNNQAVFAGDQFRIATLTYTNGTWFAKTAIIPESRFDFSVTTSSGNAALDGQTWTDTMSLVVTMNTGNTPEQNADYIYFLNSPQLGQFRVYEGRSGSVDVIAKIGSLIPVLLAHPTGGAFICFPGPDLDGDGYDTICGGDCNDNDPAIHPGATEICDGIDNNCDDDIDEGLAKDNDGDGYTNCQGDCDDNNPAVNPGEWEICDGIDNDCDAQIDEGFDNDGDGYTTCAGDCDDNNINMHPGAPEICDGIDNNCDGNIDEDFDGDGYSSCDGDCDDINPAVYPGATEVCDGIDNNCDWNIDEDFDGDGHSSCDGDCNDNDPSVNPGAVEICDGIDNNCNGTVDEGFDTDYDGHTTCGGDCDDSNPAVYLNAPELCDGIDNNCNGTSDDEWLDIDGDGVSPCGGDCNDNDINVNPWAEEICDGKDNNCDGQIDENAVDNDGDGHTDCSGDCDDWNYNVHPGAVEECDGLDNNCNGQADEGFEDTDHDGYAYCVDCDETNPAINPGAVEILNNGIDDDCNVYSGDTDADYDGYASSFDCDDNDPDVNPGAIETAYNDVDDDCNVATRDNDLDGDGYYVGVNHMTVDARSNVFAAGRSSAFEGLMPPFIRVPAGSVTTITLADVTGQISCCWTGPSFNGPDGGDQASGTTDILSYQGISGIIYGHGDLTTWPDPTLPFVAGRTMFLIGVFLNDSEPADPAPARLDFTQIPYGMGDSFFDIYPLLNQTFFIGDGLTGTGSGTAQNIHVPGGATRLYLGFADALQFGYPSSVPGYYGDNYGVLNVTVNGVGLFDCDDSNASIHPGAVEIPGNGFDENCDGIDGLDTDGDGISDNVDNCHLISNADQADSDADGIGNVCDNCSLTSNPGQQDNDHDGYGNKCDADLDNNNFVGPSDFNIFKASWLSDPSKPNWNANADFDSNNFVGPSDFNIFKTRWLKSGPWK